MGQRVSSVGQGVYSGTRGKRNGTVYGGVIRRGWRERVHCAPDVQMLYNNEGLMEIHKLHTPHTSKLSIQAYTPPSEL